MDPSRREDLGLRYLRVANDLRRKVIEREYQPGERLPRQHDLAEEHGVSFTTFKRALDLLEYEGYVVRKVGQGTYASLPDRSVPQALVVDDNASTAEYVSRALARSDWKATVVLSGKEGLARFQEHRFDLVFLDLVMPGMSGPAVFRELHELAPDVLVVIITAYADSDLLTQALQVGPFAVMKKPFSLTDIRNVLLKVRPRTEAAGPGRPRIPSRL